MNASVLTPQSLGGQQQLTRPESGESSIASSRRMATLVGVLFIIGTLAGIASVVIAGPVLGAPDDLTHIAANATPITLGALCVLTMGLALAMVPVVILPVLRKHNEPLAFGYLVFRGALETCSYGVTVISWLLLLPLSREFVSVGTSSAASFQNLGHSILRAADLGAEMTSIVFSLGAMMLYAVLYQSKLIPRWISGWGMVAALLTLIAGLTVFFGINLDLLKYVMLPQEMVMAVWLIVKGFNPSAIAADTVQSDTRHPIAT